MKPETKLLWAIIGVVVFVLFVLGEVFGQGDTCDDYCKLHQQQDRIQCIRDAADPNSC
jgi:hypothetical protein